MRYNRVFKRFSFAILLLTLLSFALWFYQNRVIQPKDELLHSYKINDSNINNNQLNDKLTLSMTKSNRGGATVPVLFLYYISCHAQSDEKNLIENLSSKDLVIKGTGTISAININNNKEINIKYHGKAFILRNSVRVHCGSEFRDLQINYLR